MDTFHSHLQFVFLQSIYLIRLTFSKITFPLVCLFSLSIVFNRFGRCIIYGPAMYSENISEIFKCVSSNPVTSANFVSLSHRGYRYIELRPLHFLIDFKCENNKDLKVLRKAP